MRSQRSELFGRASFSRNESGLQAFRLGISKIRAAVWFGGQIIESNAQGLCLPRKKKPEIATAASGSRVAFDSPTSALFRPRSLPQDSLQLEYHFLAPTSSPHRIQLNLTRSPPSRRHRMSINRKVRVLLTNDDGPPSDAKGHSPFIYGFARGLVEKLGWEVKIVVPSKQRSW